ncbi:MAG TPA: alpha/beta hydrolase [Bradyrhizobium sp.]|nr:alpha/beta hydrolase [Bradyrhizobium sp.]
MLLELVSIATEAEPLDGIFYTPKNGKIEAVALIFHGNCHNFYTGPSRFLPGVLASYGIASLAFNRRGHDMVTSLHGRTVGGGSFQLAREGIVDNRAASDWLASRGFENPIIIGHSNGGMLAAQHCADNYGNPRALVLLSAHIGGLENVPQMSSSGMFAGDQLALLTARAKEMIARGEGRELMLLPGWWWVISAESFIDRVYDTPSTVANAAKVRCPSLYLRGDHEAPEAYPAEAFAERAGAPCEVRILPNCDHFYTGHEVDVATQVSLWLKQTCKLG